MLECTTVAIINLITRDVIDNNLPAPMSGMEGEIVVFGRRRSHCEPHGTQPLKFASVTINQFRLFFSRKEKENSKYSTK